MTDKVTGVNANVVAMIPVAVFCLIVVFHIEKDGYDLPNYEQIMDGYSRIFADIAAGKIVSAYAI